MAESSSITASSAVIPEVLDQEAVAVIVNSLQKTKIDEDLPGKLVDTDAAMRKLVDALIDLPSSPPSLYIDLEGVELSRHGTISIVQIFVLPSDQTYLVDVHTLQERAFSSAGTKGQTLRDILESDAIPKAFFDVRNDSDALYSHFNVHLGGIHDIQLMELATRAFSRRCVNGLAKCIEKDAQMTTKEKMIWIAAKEKGKRLFAPERGGSYAVFNTRPLPQDILEYCVQDVQYLPKLWSLYHTRLTPRWSERLATATRDRVVQSHSAGYNGKGRHMALGPSEWA